MCVRVRACMRVCMCVYVVCVCASALFILGDVGSRVVLATEIKSVASGNRNLRIFIVLQPSRFQRKLLCYHKINDETKKNQIWWIHTAMDIMYCLLLSLRNMSLWSLQKPWLFLSQVTYVTISGRYVSK